MATLTVPNVDEGLLQSFEHFYRDAQFPVVRKYAMAEQFSAHRETEVASLDASQRALSDLFGKRPPGPPSIGDHPDFVHLKGTDDTCYCPITTMFMDIESSSRLSLLYPLETVRRVKNAFIQTAIQIIRCFDGHVHRIMGDAVMAYFGGRNAKDEESIIDGINCAAVLRHFAQSVVQPKLRSEGINHDFGIRIGLDFGKEDDVLWSSYGFPGMDEVTATSFYVDVASKLQSAASRNQAMLGGSIIQHIDFPSDLLKIKKFERDGKPCEDQYVTPNLTNAEGKPINYVQRQFDASEYLLCTPFGQHSQAVYGNGSVKPIPVRCSVHPEKKSLTKLYDYLPASRALPKNVHLKYTIKMPYLPRLPYTIRCIVENHGKDAWTADPKNGGNHTTPYTIQTKDEHDKFEHWEHTLYRGLHYLTVDVDSHGTKFRTRFGVYVE